MCSESACVLCSAGVLVFGVEDNEGRFGVSNTESRSSDLGGCGHIFRNEMQYLVADATLFCPWETLCHNVL